MGIPSTWTFAWSRSSAEKDGRRGDFLTLAYWAPKGTTDATASGAVPLLSAAPGKTGLFRPLLYRLSCHPDGTGSRVLVVLGYEPPRLSHILEDNPGRGILEGETVDDQALLVKDLDGNWVWHDEDKKRWRTVSGDPYVWSGRARLRLRWAGKSSAFEMIYGKQDTVCSHVLFGAAPGTLRFAGLHWERSTSAWDVTLYAALLEYRPDGWNKYTQAERQVFKVEKVQVVDSNGNGIANRYRDMGKWVPDKDVKPYPVKKYREIAWADLRMALL